MALLLKLREGRRQGGEGQGPVHDGALVRVGGEGAVEPLEVVPAPDEDALHADAASAPGSGSGAFTPTAPRCEIVPPTRTAASSARRCPRRRPRRRGPRNQARRGPSAPAGVLGVVDGESAPIAGPARASRPSWSPTRAPSIFAICRAKRLTPPVPRVSTVSPAVTPSLTRARHAVTAAGQGGALRVREVDGGTTSPSSDSTASSANTPSPGLPRLVRVAASVGRPPSQPWARSAPGPPRGSRPTSTTSPTVSEPGTRGRRCRGCGRGRPAGRGSLRP